MYLAPAEQCPPPDSLRFKSMGQIGKASREFSEDSGDGRAREILDSYREYRLNCIRTSLFLLRKSVLPQRVLVGAPEEA